jgi:hypothetical protein
MFLRLRPGLLAALALAASVMGCDQSLLVVDVPSRDAGPPPLVLAFVTPGPVGQPFGTSTPLEARLTDETGAPVASEEISFALDGSPAASTLDALAASTDANGIARVVLRAGDRPATYRVRASHPLASAVWLDVTVAASFGRLAVHPIWAGPPLDALTVGLFSGTDCAGAREMPDDGRTRVVPAEPPTDARFDALATDRSYTVHVRGGVAGRFLVDGCVMGVGVLADTETTVEVPLASLPLTLTGAYEAQLTLGMRSAVEVPLSTWASAATAAAGTPADDALRLVSALETALAGDAAGLAALTRLGPSGLTAALEADASAPSVVVPVELDRTIQALYLLRIEGDLSVAAGDVPTLSGRRVVADAASSAPLALAGLSVEPIVLAATYGPDAAAVIVDRLAFPMPLGALLSATLEARARSRSLPDRGALLGDAVCATLDRFVDSDAALGAACDATCRATACGAAREATWQVALAGQDDLDLLLGQVELSGTLGVRDEDRDLAVDAISGPLEGTYGPEGSAGAPIDGALAAARPFG